MKCKCGHDELAHSERLGGCLGDAILGPCHCCGWEAQKQPNHSRRAKPFRRWSYRTSAGYVSHVLFDGEAVLSLFYGDTTSAQSERAIWIVRALNARSVVLPSKVRP